MSVINQMLVDLERRRASGEERNRIPDHVRVLPDDTQAVRRPPIRIAAAALGVALIAAGAWWWLAGRSTVTLPPGSPATMAAPAPVPVTEPEPTSVPEARDTEFIARRLTLDLAQPPQPVNPAPGAAQRDAPPAIETAAVIARRPATAVQQAGIVADKPRAPPAAMKKAAETPPAPVEIDKQVRQPTPRQRADAEYSKGAVALHRGQAAEARVAFEAALQIDPMHHGSRQALVGVLLDARQPALALRVLQEGLQLAPAQHGFAMTLARLQMDNGELDAGVQTLARSLEYPGASPDYIAFYAGLLQRQQKHAEAAAQFQRALGQRGNVGVWLLGLGVSLEALGRGAEAQEAYRLAKASGNLSADLQSFADQKLR
ncbi:MAG: tetratricopeptide repeat protein [Burkholderiales bacterium]|jgi:MSHA biogenesis protein MshN|nr:tetratricopeptide repeat protein [Burkholderiales bacterium]